MIGSVSERQTEVTVVVVVVVVLTRRSSHPRRPLYRPRL